MFGRTLCIAVLALALLAPSASALPVPYSASHAGDAWLANGSPPGANDWSCTPSARHPRPVVLLHGLGANMAANWDTMAPLLENEGYCVFALTYGTTPGQERVGGLIRMERSAEQLKAFVARVLAATGAQEVDLVGHSEGTVMPRYYLKFLGGDAKVARLVALTPLYRGTTLFGLSAVVAGLERLVGADVIDGVMDPLCGSCRQFLTGSPFLTKLNAGGYTVPGVRYTNIVTRYDETVIPYTSGVVKGPNVTNIVLQRGCALDFSEHIAVAFSAVTGRHLLNALDPEHARPALCVPVLPFEGSPQMATR